MIIGNRNSYLKNPYVNNNNYTQQNKVLNNNNKIATAEKKSVSLSPDIITKKKIKALKNQLNDIETSEQQLQSGMSTLHQKETGLNNITDIGNQLTELSKQYKKSDLSEKDKLEIEKKADELINNLGRLMNDNKTEENNIVGNKKIQLNSSDGKSTTILSKGIDITLDLDKVDKTKLNNPKDDKHFSSNVSVKTLLENHSIIQERMLNPVQSDVIFPITWDES